MSTIFLLVLGIKKYGIFFVLSAPHFSLFSRQFPAIFSTAFKFRYAPAAPVGGISPIFCG